MNKEREEMDNYIDAREESTGYSYERVKTLEELGYTKMQQTDCWEKYIKDTNANIRYIEFETNERLIVPRDINYEFIALHADELKAIYQICKDKGWI